MWALIASDVRAKARWSYERDDWRSVVKVLLSDGTAAMLLYRFMQGCRRRRLVPLELCFNKLISLCGGCVIGRGAEFGPGFVLIHSIGVVINGSVRGGANVHLEHQVTIGAEGRRSPRLGDDVFVGAGAKIIGGITVGSRTRVGANAVVLADVPSDATAVGVPARIIRRGPRRGSQLTAARTCLDGRDLAAQPEGICQ